jgi:hypothetical protein
MSTSRHSALLVVLTLFGSIAQAQEEVLTNRVGTKLGTRSAFTTKCQKAWADEPSFAMFDRDRFCACVLPIVLSTEAIATASNPRILDNVDLAALVMNNPTSFDQLTACTGLDINSVRLVTIGEEGLSDTRKGCAEQLAAEVSIKQIGADPVALCDCVINEMVARDLTIGDFYKAMDPNSPSFNEVFMPCVTKAIPERETGHDAAKDVTGSTSTITLPVVTYGSVHKVKLRIGGSEQYFIIDSGAEDCFISAKLLAELQQAPALDGTVKLEDREYVLADGKRTTCARHIVNGIEIGDWKVDNVVVAVIDQDIQYLLGKSFLKKFKQWRIDEAARTLTLERN